MTNFVAVPYSYNLSSFSFSTYDEYQEKLAIHQTIDLKKNLCGDYEHYIECIDGDEQGFFSDEINSYGFEEKLELFERYQELSDLEKVAYDWLVNSIGLDEDEALQRADEVNIFEGEAKDYAFDLIAKTTDMSDIPDIIRYNIDYEAIAHDLLCGGDICLHGTYDEYVITNRNDF